MQRVCVFSGSNLGVRVEYREAARELGRELLARGVGLVYGGASVGLMGVLADTVLAGGGEVVGVTPRGLFQREAAHRALSRLYEVGSMHERKALMADLSDGFIALPGGFGTFDELFEITTWAQLGLHAKPVGLLDVADYFTPLLAMISHAADEGFIARQHIHILLHAHNSAALLDALAIYSPQVRSASKWMDMPPER